jgi:3-oxoacyl-(acyl-carrier-protein) synthase
MRNDFLNSRVVITGLGVVWPLGTLRKARWDAIQAGRRAAGDFTRLFAVSSDDAGPSRS